MELGYGFEQAKAAQERSMRNGNAGRGALVAVLAGLCVVSILISAPAVAVVVGLATALAGVSWIKGIQSDRAVRRFEERISNRP